MAGEFADRGRPRPHLMRQTSRTQTQTRSSGWEMGAHMRTRLSELRDGKRLGVVATFCAKGFSRVSAAFATAKTTPPSSIRAADLIMDLLDQAICQEIVVSRSSPLVIIECVRRALDGLSPPSGVSGKESDLRLLDLHARMIP